MFTSKTTVYETGYPYIPHNFGLLLTLRSEHQILEVINIEIWCLKGSWNRSQALCLHCSEGHDDDHRNSEYATYAKPLFFHKEDSSVLMTS